jgi:sterol desaturase/sphingolipid hydroxylase (fatty acid hydroxylase superfamily)
MTAWSHEDQQIGIPHEREDASLDRLHFQRPEMHRIHHEYAQHRNNYGDIVWWDMLFGTYENPKEFTTSCGFDDDKEQRLRDMLRFEDVHKA